MEIEKLSSMYLKLSEDQRMLSKNGGECSIFRVPHILKDANPEAYKPVVVSIGPYHHGHNDFNMIEEHKWCYLRSLLSRTKTIGLSIEDLLKAMASLESKARECYLETITLYTYKFIEMMVVDGCFIIELFRKDAGIVSFEENDPIFTTPWILPTFCRDFLKLENQIPFFVLQRLFDLSKLPEEDLTQTLLSIAMKFFSKSLSMPKIQVLDQQSGLVGKHLLDLVRTSFIPSDLQNEAMDTPTRCLWSHINYPKVRTNYRDISTSMIQCVSKLHHAGIKITHGNKSDSFLQVKYKHGLIQMPTIRMNSLMKSFLLNCVAFEQCYNSSNHFTTYMNLLECLISTHRDVEYLCDKNIIDNYLGTEEEVASFITTARKNVMVDMDSSYLSKLFKEVDECYENSWHEYWASFKYTPRSFILALVVFILLVLTACKTFFVVYA